jgi:hypothetical protein
VRYQSPAVVHDLDSAQRFYTEKPTEYAAMLLAPLCLMPRLMPSTTEDSDFAPDIIGLMRHVPGRYWWLREAASALAETPEFLERVRVWARKLRPLIRTGGTTLLSAQIARPKARSTSVGSTNSGL